MASEIKVDTIVNAGGDNDSGIDLGTNDAVKVTIAGSEKARVDSNGHLLVSKTSTGIGTVGAELKATGELLATVSGDACAFLNRTTSDGAMIDFRKDGSTVGNITTFSGDLVIGTGDTGLFFNDSSDHIKPVTTASDSNRDDAIDLGSAGSRFDNIRASNGSIVTSDKNEKNTITDSDLGLDFVNRLSPKSYKFNNKTRTHYGLIAQDVETVLGDVKKDATQFAGFCKDDISEKQDGSEYRYGLRYHEFISPMIQAIKDLKEEVDTLKAKVVALESK